MISRGCICLSLAVLAIAVGAENNVGNENVTKLLVDGPVPGSSWKCSVCAHVYDPVKDGSGVAFEQLPSSWVCPVCGAPKSAYRKESGDDGTERWVHFEHANVKGELSDLAPALSSREVVSGSSWKCSVCAHVYDPVKDGSGVAFEQLPSSWVCPVCGAPKSAYRKESGTDGTERWVHFEQANVKGELSDLAPALSSREVVSGSSWKCSVCAHVYDPVKDGNGVPFEQLPVSWVCPVCGAPKSAYRKESGADGTEQWIHFEQDNVKGEPSALAPAPSSLELVSGSSWKCSVCAHVYDPVKDGSGMPFEQLPSSWVCPVCGAPKSAYRKETASDGTEQWIHFEDAEIEIMV